MRKNKPSKKTIEKYYIEREILLTPAEAKKNGELPSKIEKIALTKKEAEYYKNETLKTFLESKKQEIKTFLESHGCIVGLKPYKDNKENQPGGCTPKTSKGKWLITINKDKGAFTYADMKKQMEETVFISDNLNESRKLTHLCFQEIQELQNLFNAGKYEKAVILAFSIGEDIQRLFRMGHLLNAGTKYKSDKSRGKTLQITRLAESEPLREKYLSIFRAGKDNLKTPSINKTFRNWCWENNILKKDQPKAKTLNRWRKSAGL